MFDQILYYLNDMLTFLVALVFLPLGIFVCCGGLASLRRYFYPESRRQRSVFAFVALITITTTGIFLSVASIFLLYGVLSDWVSPRL